MQPKLYEAAKSGDFDYLIRMSGCSHIFNETTPMGNNLLHVAAQHEQGFFIEQLLAQYPSTGQSLLFQGNHRGDTPLHIAAKVDSPSISKIFIDFAKSPISNVGSGQVDRREELLRMENVDKDTALHYAARYGCSSVVTLLIEEDPELCNITNDAYESPLYLATSQGHFETTKRILDASLPSSSHKGSRGMTALHAALYYKAHPNNFVKAIVERSPQLIRERDDIGWTPLHYAACYDKIEAVQLFLQHDDSAAYLLDNDGESALHIAAFLGHIDVIKELDKSLPDACELINNKGRTALHTAVIGGRLNAVKFIVKMPSFKHLLNEQDKDGNTAIHLAAVHQQYDIVKLLAQDKRVKAGISNKGYLTALGIMDKHEEARLSFPFPVLKNKFGVQDMQDHAIQYVKESLENRYVESQSAMSTATINNNMNNQEKVDPAKAAVSETSHVPAAVAAISFAAGLAVPGGLNNQGIANSAGKSDFESFMSLITTACVLSLLALFVYFEMSFQKNGIRRGTYAALIHVYRCFTKSAIVALIYSVAYATSVGLPKTAWQEFIQEFFHHARLWDLISIITVFFAMPMSLSVIFSDIRQLLIRPRYEYGVKSLY